MSKKIKDWHNLGPSFERYLKRHEMAAVEKYAYNGFEIYIGAGGPYFDKNKDFSAGWFETVYLLVTRDPKTDKRITLYQPMMFEINHDLNLAPDTRRQARINSTKHAAQTHVDEFRKSWRKNSIIATLH